MVSSFQMNLLGVYYPGLDVLFQFGQKFFLGVIKDVVLDVLQKTIMCCKDSFEKR